MTSSILAPLLLALVLSTPALAAERRPVAPARVEAAEAADPKALRAALEARLAEGGQLAASLDRSADKIAAATQSLQDLRGESFLARDHAALNQIVAKFDVAGLRAGMDELGEAARHPFWRSAGLTVPSGLGKELARLAAPLARLEKALKPDSGAASDALPFKRVMALQGAGDALLTPLMPLLGQARNQRAALDRASLAWRGQADNLRQSLNVSTAPKITPPSEDKETAKIREAIAKAEQDRKEKQP
ncbi:MAG: hypothetical protein Q8O33_03685 [Pseudomonadota bacterium]|nr:hypothetical protein [Pseudomonadota bacterium]